MNDIKSFWTKRLTAAVSAMLVVTFAPSAVAASPEAVSVEQPAAASPALNASGELKEDQNALGTADPAFREIFSSWKKMDKIAEGKVSIPSRKPVNNVRLTSQFGFRADPFRGRRARHKGIDIAGPRGTPIYATADGIVGRAQWVGGYGRYVEINHGNKIQTRYGHMSRLNVRSNQRVRRGEVIGYMGSTGRSTGNHLHYEVRIDGKAVNPMPFVQATEYLLAARSRDRVALGGPAD